MVRIRLSCRCNQCLELWFMVRLGLALGLQLCLRLRRIWTGFGLGRGSGESFGPAELHCLKVQLSAFSLRVKTIHCT